MERGLIIQKKYLDKILNNGKTWEMRTTKTSIRGRIGLIEAGTGLVVGEANLTGCGDRPITKLERILTAEFHQVTNLDLLEKWKYPWFLDDVKKYKKPKPYSHKAGAVIWVKF